MEGITDQTAIAIVGIALRLPAGISTTTELWQLLMAGRNVIGKIPTERWTWPPGIHTQTDHVGIDQGGFLSCLDQFDAAFFRISDREAELMDPQQRLLMELSWECLEDAAWMPSSLSGSKTGVYIGACGSDYRSLIERSQKEADPYMAFGTAMAVLPNRISYFYNFRGPSLLIDTACSSSLVALHEAIRSLRTQECEQALVGGVNVMCEPTNTIAFYKAGMLAKDGRCKTFDARADGIARSEGAIMMVLKPLAKALRDSDHIYATIRGSAVNHGGKAWGLTVPNLTGQVELIEAAFRDANVSPDSVCYVEAHGTGTFLGDPIEVAALKEAFARLGGDCIRGQAWCGLGSVKGNLGHLEAAAGLAGVLKVVLAFRHSTVPRCATFSELNPRIGLADSPFFIVQTPLALTTDGSAPHRASVSSFGAGGANALVLIEEFVNQDPRTNEANGPVVIVLSARTEAALNEQVGRLLELLERDQHGVEWLHDAAYTLQMGREAMAVRLAMLVDSQEELVLRFRDYLQRGVTTGMLFHKSGADAETQNQTVREEDSLPSAIESREFRSVLESWVRGETVHWSRLHCGQPRRRLPLPTYPFERRPFWVDQANSPARPSGREADGGKSDPAELLTLFPVWDRVPLTVSPAHRPQDHQLVLLGGSDQDWMHVRTVWPKARRFHQTIDESKDRIAALADLSDGDYLIWIAPNHSTTEVGAADLIEAQHAGVVSLFKTVQGLLHGGLGAKSIQLTVITKMAKAIHRDAEIDPAHAGVHGLIGTLAKEVPRWVVRMVDVEQDIDTLFTDIPHLPTDSRAHVWAYRNDAWYQQQLIPLRPYARDGGSGFRAGGVYVVLGGAGRIGQYLSEHVIREYQANVVWIGRSQKNASIDQALDRLATFGPRPIYLCADATDLSSLQRARAEIRTRFGRIHGLIHAAVVFSQRRIEQMTEAEFCASLSSKVDTSVRAWQTFGEESLDFVLFISSLVTHIRNIGQSHYAAGCSFQEAYSHHLCRTSLSSVKVLHSGYWIGNDVDVDEVSRLREAGLDLLTPQEGVGALCGLLEGPLWQVGVLRARRSLRIEGVNYESNVTSPDHAVEVLRCQTIAEHRIPTPARAVDYMRHRTDMDALIGRLLLDQLAQTGYLDETKPPPAPYARWLSESMRLLHDRGLWLPSSTEAAAAWRRWEDYLPQWSCDPELGAQARLVDATLRALPRVLTLRCAPTDVLFPNSTANLVKGIYQDNATADYCNDVIAQCAVRYLHRRIESDARSIRCLEIGAGTGATTGRVWQALLPLAQYVSEYAFTDLSPTLVREAKAREQPKGLCVDYRVMDVERSLAEQGIAVGAYDLVIATNVLHATRDIHEAIRNTKSALCPGGMLLLNELTRNELWMHVSFGLLPGWWRHEDSQLRIVGAPLLSPQRWKSVLSIEGFRDIVTATPAPSELGQQILVAQSDGTVRYKIGHPTVSTLKSTDETSKARPPATTTEENIRSIILRELARSLRRDASQIDHGAPFADYGVDSIGGVRVIQAINQALSVKLPTTCLFDYSTVDRLTAHIATDHRPVTSEMPQDSVVPGRARVKEPNAPQSDRTQSQMRPASSCRERIAIIGMSGRFPKADDVNELWRHLAAGADLTEDVTRWPLPEFTTDKTRRMCRRGGFLDTIDRFDPQFFGISGTEATYMDPQQRLLLQESWKALENAGYAGASVVGTRCGVYIGCSGEDYSRLAVGTPPPQALWGSSLALLPSRIAYFLDLQGPAITVDTACSSSLVAVHLACQGLWTGETQMAIAGGVWIHCLPSFYEIASRAGMLSPSGRCHTFDERADGFIPSEGVGVVVLKRLQDAVDQGDHIYGVILGSGINQDGTSNGITAPSAAAQERLETEIYDTFKIDPAQIQMVEAHGTGTVLGDPIEHQALTRAFRRYTMRTGYCALGSIKTNIGHTGAAAGVAGLIKVLLAFQHEQIPPTLNFDHCNPAVDLVESPFYVNTALRDWPVETGVPRRAAVSAFGVGGTNAHVVIEQAPPYEVLHGQRPAYLIALSGRNPGQLRQQVAQLLGHCEQDLRIDCGDISFTLLVGRRHHSCRWACIASDSRELVRELRKWLEGSKDTEAYVSTAPERRASDSAKFNCEVAQLNEIQQPQEYRNRLSSLARLYVQGDHGNVTELFEKGYRRIALPTYPFAKDSYWLTRTHDEVEQVTTAGAVVMIANPTDRICVKARVVDFLSVTLGVPAQDLTDNRDLREYGADSIVTAKLQRLVKEAFGLTIAGRELLDCTVDSVVDVVVRQASSTQSFDSGEDARDMLRRFQEGTVDLATIERLIDDGLLA